jgi:ribonuclease D
MVIAFPGQIHLINTDQKLHEALRVLRDAKELGFDTETRPSFKKGEVYKVALLQLATESDAYLLRLQQLNEFEGVRQLFENPAIVKVGVAIRDDLKLLQKLFSFTPHGFVELQDVAKERGLKNFGLKGMTEEVLQAGLSKAAKMTNWEAQTLTEQQLKYAATDAWVGLRLFQALRQPPWI